MSLPSGTRVGRQHFVVVSRMPSRVPPALTLLGDWPEMVQRATPSTATSSR